MLPQLLKHYLNDLFFSLFKDELTIFISKDAITLQRVKHRLFNRKLVENQRFFVTESLDLSTHKAPWQAALTLLASLLTQDKWRNTVAHVVLSNQFCHYVVVPWQSDITNQAEQAAYTKHCFVSQFGDAANHWHICSAEASFEEPCVASAIGQPLIDALIKLLAVAGLPLKAIHPYLMMVTNKASKQIAAPQHAYWLVIAADGRLLLSLIEHNAWQLVNNIALNQDATTLAQQISISTQRENVLLNRNAGVNNIKDTLLLHVPYLTPLESKTLLAQLTRTFHQVKLIPSTVNPFIQASNAPATNPYTLKDKARA